KTGDADGLANCIGQVSGDVPLMQEMAEQNFAAALGMTMPQIIGQYLRSFDVQKHQRALERFSRFRRIPGWVPSHSALFRAASPVWASWTAMNDKRCKAGIRSSAYCSAR